MSESSCASCAAFFRFGPDAKAGACRAHAPVPMITGMIQPQLQGQRPRPLIDSFWPSVGESDWCGEHRPGAGRTAVPVVTPDALAEAVALANADVEGSA